MTVQQITNALETLAPLAYAEDFDNTGLLVGSYTQEVTGVLITLDTLETVVDEAIATQCNLIVSFHPIIFKGLKKITDTTYVSRTVKKALENKIAIYAIHTALDNANLGVSHKMAEKLNLINSQTLIPQKNTLKKLVTYIPTSNFETVQEALFQAGAGQIGAYSHCSFNVTGQGSFLPLETANPTIGEVQKRTLVNEQKLSVVFQAHLETSILKALKTAHPYEEVAFEIFTLENTNPYIGMGKIGTLAKPLSGTDFLALVKSVFGTHTLKHSALTSKPIKRVAVLGGSGSFAISQAIGAGADAYITADLKYHDYFTAEEKLLLIDVGHYESEQFTKDLLFDYLNEKICSFAPALPKGRVCVSKVNTNPISYY